MHSGDRAKRVESAEVAAALGADPILKIMDTAARKVGLVPQHISGIVVPQSKSKNITVPIKDLKAVLKAAERCINFLIANDTFTYGSLCVNTEYFLSAYNRTKKLVKNK